MDNLEDYVAPDFGALKETYIDLQNQACIGLVFMNTDDIRDTIDLLELDVYLINNSEVWYQMAKAAAKVKLNIIDVVTELSESYTIRIDEFENIFKLYLETNCRESIIPRLIEIFISVYLQDITVSDRGNWKNIVGRKNNESFVSEIERIYFESLPEQLFVLNDLTWRKIQFKESSENLNEMDWIEKKEKYELCDNDIVYLLSDMKKLIESGNRAIAENSKEKKDETDS